MDDESFVAIQHKFTNLHKILVIVIIVYNLELLILKPDAIMMSPSLAALGLVIFEILLMKKVPVKKSYFTIFRYVQVFICMIFLLQCKHIYSFALCFMIFSLLAIEFYLTLDFTDFYYQVIFLFCIGFPLAVVLLVEDVWSGKIGEDFVGRFCMITGYLAILFVLSGIISRMAREYEKRLYSKGRMVSRVNESNQKLIENKKKLEDVNRLLGEQKIELEEAYHKINRVNSEVMIQNEIIKYLSSALEIETLMTLITDSIIKEIRVDICAIVLYPDAAGNKLIQYKIKTRQNSVLVNQLSIAIEKGNLMQFFLHGETYVDNHVDENKYQFTKEANIGSLIMVPLIKEKAMIGVLFVGHSREHYFMENIEFFETIITQFLVALNNANLYAKMEELATKDHLTGIYNRGYFTKLFDQALKEVIGNDSDLTVTLFDIDFFKKINDTYGHLFGDEVIKEIASLSAVISAERKGIAGRYGGEEFVIFFPNQKIVDVLDAIQLLQNKIKELEWIRDGQKVSVNVSMGVTSYPETCENPDDLLNHADWAMYYSKQHGRKMITIDSEKVRQNVLIK